MIDRGLVRSLCAVLAASLVLASTGCETPMARARVDVAQLEVGMGHHEVTSLLGPPESTLRDPNGVQWIYRYPVDGGTRVGLVLLILGIVTAPFYFLAADGQDPVTFGLHFDRNSHLERWTEVTVED